MSIIRFDNVDVIFSKDPREALKLLDQGMSRNEILKKTGQIVGVEKASLDIEKGVTRIEFAGEHPPELEVSDPFVACLHVRGNGIHGLGVLFVDRHRQQIGAVGQAGHQQSGDTSDQQKQHTLDRVSLPDFFSRGTQPDGSACRPDRQRHYLHQPVARLSPDRTPVKSGNQFTDSEHHQDR